MPEGTTPPLDSLHSNLSAAPTNTERLRGIIERSQLTLAVPNMVLTEGKVVDFIQGGWGGNSYFDGNISEAERYGKIEGDQLTDVETFIANNLKAQLSNDIVKKPIIALDAGMGINNSWSKLLTDPLIKGAVDDGNLILVGVSLSTSSAQPLEEIVAGSGVYHVKAHVLDLLNAQIPNSKGEMVDFKGNCTLILDSAGPLKHSVIPDAISQEYSSILRQDGLLLAQHEFEEEGSAYRKLLPLVLDLRFLPLFMGDNQTAIIQKASETLQDNFISLPTIGNFNVYQRK